MSPFEATVRRVKRDLDALKLQWAFVGGLAVSTRAYQRFTNDVDVAIVVADDRAAEQLAHALLQTGYTFLAQLERDDGRMATLRLVCPPIRGTQFVLDLLFATTGIEGDIVRRARREAIFPNFTAPVATLSDLIVMKLLSVSEARGKDEMDLDELVARASPADLASARGAIERISGMGLARDRDLGQLLDKYVARRTSPSP